MPIYDTVCTNEDCSHRGEAQLAMGEQPAAPCPLCGAKMVKIPGIGGYSIKGNNSASQRPRRAGSFGGMK